MAFIVYRHFSKSGELLYIGASLKAFQRLESHKYSSWADEIETVTLERFETEGDMWWAELRAIEEEGPTHNRVANPKYFLAQKKKLEGITPKTMGGLALQNLMLVDPGFPLKVMAWKLGCSVDSLVSFVIGEKPKERIVTRAWRMGDVRIHPSLWDMENKAKESTND